MARKGRVEVALDKTLAEHDEIGLAERAALRSQARAVDLAEEAADPYAVTAANHAYLELRTAAGLTVGSSPPVDSFAELLADLARPTAGLRDAADP